MAESASPSVLKRKVEAGRSPVGGSTMPLVKALHHALAKTAQDLMALPVEITALRDMRLSIAEIPEQLADRSLLAVLAGPGDGLGLMALSPETLATLIEMQTTGRIGATPVVPRRPTRTDAAMSSKFINDVLTGLEVLLATDAEITWIGGFRYSTYLDDPRPLGLLLEDAAYRGFQISLRFGGDPGRDGGLLLALPAVGRGPMPERSNDGDRRTPPEQPGCSPTDWPGRIQQAVLGTRAQVEAVLERLAVPLSQVLALQPGSVLVLPAQALQQVRIEGRGRQFVTHAKLGQCQGKLAVRILEGTKGESEVDGFVPVGAYSGDAADPDARPADVPNSNAAKPG